MPRARASEPPTPHPGAVRAVCARACVRVCRAARARVCCACGVPGVCSVGSQNDFSPYSRRRMRLSWVLAPVRSRACSYWECGLKIILRARGVRVHTSRGGEAPWRACDVHAPWRSSQSCTKSTQRPKLCFASCGSTKYSSSICSNLCFADFNGGRQNKPISTAAAFHAPPRPRPPLTAVQRHNRVPFRTRISQLRS